jgi:beta-glucosidase
MIIAIAFAACMAGNPSFAQAQEPPVPGIVNGTVNPENWPIAKAPKLDTARSEARVEALLRAMTVEQKVGQIIQADISAITPQEARDYQLGSILNGGNSAPNSDEKAPPAEWLKLADAFWQASTDKSKGGHGIPVIWGTDAVHGHNNIVGATLFPHNIGLGAANNPSLMEAIGRVTAREIRVTGLDWTFAPTLAVVRDDRWGRTYESYSESPAIVTAYAPRLVAGLQGRVSASAFLKGAHVPATAKHFVGDGGTEGGKDQGDNIMSEAQLRDLQSAGYRPAIEAGVQSIMASYNSWHGQKMHGHREMLTDVLRGRFNFNGLVVGDWNGHGQVAGCTAQRCAASINAGLDLFMAPDSWKALYANTLDDVKNGAIPMARLDEAVRRVLRIKVRSGLLDAPTPSKRALAGQWSILGSKEHRAVARAAVQQSLVLLKNRGILPIKPGAKVIVAGDGANDIGRQSGGWTLSWQGTGNNYADFPNGQSIYAGLEQAVRSAGGTAQLVNDEQAKSAMGDVAIIVFGEDPYAEFQGDRDHLDFEPTGPLTLLRDFKARNIPTVSVFLSGRPMWVNPELNASDAFVAAWLPGSEGGGIADVLIARGNGKAAKDFTGRLSFSWPKSSYQTVNVGDAGYDPLFAYGYGLSYRRPGPVAQLPETEDLAGRPRVDISKLMTNGVAQSPWTMTVLDTGGERALTTNIGESVQKALLVSAIDNDAQENARRVRFTGNGGFGFKTAPIDYRRQSTADMIVQFSYRVAQVSAGPATLGGLCEGADCRGSIDITSALSQQAGKGWQQASVKLSCFANAGLDLSKMTSAFWLAAGAGTEIELRDIAITTNLGAGKCTL